MSKLSSEFTFLPSNFHFTSGYFSYEYHGKPTKGKPMHFNTCSNLMCAFLILETYFKICSLVFGEREVGKKSMHSKKQPILIKNARLICLSPRATDILPLGCCVDFSAICLNINNSHFHTCLSLQFVKMVSYSSKLFYIWRADIYRKRECMSVQEQALVHNLSTKD